MELSVPGASPSRADGNAPPILLEGMLFKRGQGGLFHRANWKLRYVVLTATSLRYYDLGVRKGELDLTQTSAQSILIFPTGMAPSPMQWQFGVKTPKRAMLFCASTEAEMNRWIRQLHAAAALRRGDTKALDKVDAVYSRQAAAGMAVLTSPRDKKRSPRRSNQASDVPSASFSMSHAIILQAHRRRTSELDDLADRLCSNNFVAKLDAELHDFSF
ncbi:hypothetical protein AC1031_015686 [Aphanomyces cochlioides]|nr:hypothetical protein AC1031_015686 [Aphanomyces cochlioides]